MKSILPGQVFHYLTVLSSNGTKCLCRCICGGTTTAHRYDLHRGHTKSCGCKRIESVRLRRTSHGESKTGGEYDVWCQMKSRCYSRNNPTYKNYGGRGIKVCDRWKKYENFLDDMGRRPSPKHSIERKNNDGDYEPGNCIWATRTEQCRNKRNNRWITYKGERLTLSEWAKKAGMRRTTLRMRLDVYKWSFAKAITPPKKSPLRE